SPSAQVRTIPSGRGGNPGGLGSDVLVGAEVNDEIGLGLDDGAAGFDEAVRAILTAARASEPPLLDRGGLPRLHIAALSLSHAVRHLSSKSTRTDAHAAGTRLSRPAGIGASTLSGTRGVRPDRREP